MTKNEKLIELLKSKIDHMERLSWLQEGEITRLRGALEIGEKINHELENINRVQNNLIEKLKDELEHDK